MGTGTLTISVGDSSFSIEVAEGGNSLANIRDAINKSAANKGVQASLLTDVEGTHLVLTSTKTGADHALTVTASGGNGGLEQSRDNMEVRSEAQDAIVFVSGYEIHSASNTVSNAIEGVTLTLKAPTEEGSTVLLGVDRDDAAIQDAAKKFVDAYNSLAGTIKSLSRYDVATEAAGTLLGDAMLRNIESQVRKLISSPVSGVNGNYTTLASLGITTQADGKLKLDTVRFNAALDGQPWRGQRHLHLQQRCRGQACRPHGVEDLRHGRADGPQQQHHRLARRPERPAGRAECAHEGHRATLLQAVQRARHAAGPDEHHRHLARQLAEAEQAGLRQ